MREQGRRLVAEGEGTERLEVPSPLSSHVSASLAAHWAVSLASMRGRRGPGSRAGRRGRPRGV